MPAFFFLLALCNSSFELFWRGIQIDVTIVFLKHVALLNDFNSWWFSLGQSQHILYHSCFTDLLRLQLLGILSLLSPLFSVWVCPPRIVPPGLLLELQTNTQTKKRQELSYFPKVNSYTKIITCWSYIEGLQRLSTECRKTRTKPITYTYQLDYSARLKAYTCSLNQNQSNCMLCSIGRNRWHNRNTRLDTPNHLNWERMLGVTTA